MPQRQYFPHPPLTTNTKKKQKKKTEEDIRKAVTIRKQLLGDKKTPEFLWVRTTGTLLLEAPQQVNGFIIDWLHQAIAEQGRKAKTKDARRFLTARWCNLFICMQGGLKWGTEENG